MYYISFNLQLSKPPMGNKLGQHGEAASSTASPAEASAVTSNKNSSSNKKSTTALSSTPEDHLDDQVAEVPPPMEPIAHIPAVTTTSTTSDAAANLDDLEQHTAAASSSLSKPNNRCDDQQHVIPNTTSVSDSVEPHLQERAYRLQELLETERTYISKLEQCCQYIQFMRESKEKEDHELPMPEDLRAGKDRIIFSNIEAIYEWHRE